MSDERFNLGLLWFVIIVAAIALAVNTAIHRSELRDLQRRVGQLEQGR